MCTKSELTRLTLPSFSISLTHSFSCYYYWVLLNLANCIIMQHKAYHKKHHVFRFNSRSLSLCVVFKELLRKIKMELFSRNEWKKYKNKSNVNNTKGCFVMIPWNNKHTIISTLWGGKMWHKVLSLFYILNVKLTRKFMFA